MIDYNFREFTDSILIHFYENLLKFKLVYSFMSEFWFVFVQNLLKILSKLDQAKTMLRWFIYIS